MIMARRIVTHLKRGEDHDILMLCNHRETWSPRLKEDAIRDIENNLNTYRVIIDYSIFEVIVVDDPEKGKILATRPELPPGH